jgi:tetratricopeptide (TPR) repeat protein
MGLLLEAVDADGAWRWRWVLRDSSTGAILAGHPVALDPASDELTAFGNLYAYVRWHVSPDRRSQDETRILRRVGSWASESLLGVEVCAAIAAAAPVTVWVTVPEALDHVLLWPLELAHAAGKPLLERGDVAFVYDIVPGAAGAVAPEERSADDALRILAVFSLPAGTALTGERRERYELSRLIRQVTEHGRAVELRVLQYGVTRKLLAEVADSGKGWDVLHLSSHGSPGLFGLEKPDGSPDWVTTSDLIGLLRFARRVKLAVVGSCLSAAEDEAAAPARLIGPAVEVSAEATAQHRAPHVTGLARGLVRELGCAVVATRYLVTAEHMTAFNAVFYASLLDAGDPVDVAAARALAESSPGDRSVYRVSPGVFGARAVGLTFRAPRRRVTADQVGQRKAGLPDEPERFVGRVATISAATAVLAADSEKTVVALHGMPGIGATTCALELAYRQQDNFTATAYWRAPGRGASGSADAPAAFAASLQDQLGLPLPSRWPTRGWEGYARRLSRALRRRRLLLVLDDVDALLSSEGEWRDPRWTLILTALTAHGGQSRLILAGRIPPPVDGQASRVFPLGLLQEDEAYQMVRELPSLRALRWPAPNRAAADGARGRDLVDAAAAGHPGLLSLMNEWAADPDTLDARLAEARDEIADWARATVASRRPNARLMAEFLACLTDEDQRKAVVEATWPRLWKRLGRPGEPPEPEPLLDALAAVTLIRRPDSAIVMHPAVVAATRAAATRDIRDSADEVLAGFWQAAPGSVSSDPGESARFVLPYLVRQEACGSAANVLAALTPAQLSGIGPSAIPMLRKVVAETGSPTAQVALAVAVRQSHNRKLPEVRELLEDALSSALAAGDLRQSWVAAGFLVNRHITDGRLQAALELAAKREAYARLGGLGPWTRLASAANRLAVQQRMGQHAPVLAEIDRLRIRLDQLPDDDPDDSDPASAPELVTPWSVREDLLETGNEAAGALGQWQRALDMSTEALASMRGRGESGYGLAAWQRQSAEWLVRLGRLAEAAALLADCQQAAADRGYREDVAYVLSIRADLEEARGRPDTAADLERASLRLRYAEDLGPDTIAACHRRLGYVLSVADGDKDEAAAHSIAGLLILRLIQKGTDPVSLAQAAALARQDADRRGHVPWTVAEVVQVADRVDGVRLGELLATLEPDQQALAEALNRLVAPRPDAVTLIDWAARGLARWLREK